MSKKSVTNISNNHFVGVHYDSKAVEAINMIATGLIENARGLSALAQILKASNVEIETFLSVK